MACLERAHQDGIKSIGFPSMGTGSLGFPEEYIAKIMYNSVKKFSLSHKQTQLHDIRFVIFEAKIKKVYFPNAIQLIMYIYIFFR